MITVSRNTAQRGIGCRRCRIIRMFIIATLFIVIGGLVGGEKLHFLSLITAEGVATTIWIAGGLLFIIKLLLWRFGQLKNKFNDPEQV